MHVTKSIALVCALLLGCSSVLPSKGSLAAYSETRSFRDALDGRSMEEAISGPVDRDTSSYGDRTTSGGSPSPSGGGQMMLTIPANGNLNGVGAAEEPAAQKGGSGSGNELEREAGPVSGVPMDTQQQMMEMNQNGKGSAKQQQQQQAGGRQTYNNRAGSMAQMRNGRQQQQQYDQADSSYGSKQAPQTPTSQQAEQASFGEEATKGGQRGYGEPKQQPEQQQPQQSPMPAAASPGAGGYGTKQAAGGESENEQQPTQQQQQQQQQQQPDQQSAMPMGGASANNEQAGYGDEQQQVAAKQRAMAAMLMSMSNGMKYSRMSGAGNMNGMAQQQYGDKMKGQQRQQQYQPMGMTSSMARNAMMSMANKAAYMGQQQRSLRQMAPPMMMLMSGPASEAQGSPAASYSSSRMANGGAPMQTMTPMSMSSNYRAARGGSRRANQRMMAMRKMSPVMMNAMLNKMLNMKQQEQQSGYGSGANGNGNGNGNGYGMSAKPPTEAAMAAMANLMKTPMGAEMLMANVMANNMGPQMASVMAGMPPMKREQYKRMMVAAMMANQENGMSQDNSYNNGGQQQQQQEEQQQQSDGPYGAQAGTQSPASAYGMSPASMMSGAGSGSRGYDDQQRSQKPASDYGAKKGQKSGSDDGSYQEQGGQEQENGDSAGYGNGAAKGRSGARQGGYGAQSMGGQAKGTKGAGEADQQQMKEGYGGSDSMEASMKPMNGFRQAYTPAGASMRGNSNNYGARAGGSDYGSPMPMSRPMMTMMMPQQQQESYDEQQKQTNDGSNTEQQQEMDGYGAAPKGEAEPFAFDYKIEDDYGNGQYRKEESDKNGVVRGSYGYTDVKGIYRHVEYVADENGFRAKIKSNEPGLSSEPTPKGGENGSGSNSASGSGYEPTNGSSNGGYGANSQSMEQMPMGNGNGQQQQQQQQQQMMMTMMPSQVQMNENGEKKKK